MKKAGIPRVWNPWPESYMLSGMDLGDDPTFVVKQAKDGSWSVWAIMSHGVSTEIPGFKTELLAENWIAGVAKEWLAQLKEYPRD